MAFFKRKTVRLELATGGLKKSAPIEHFSLIENLYSKIKTQINKGFDANVVLKKETLKPEMAVLKKQTLTTLDDVDWTMNGNGALMAQPLVHQAQLMVEVLLKII